MKFSISERGREQMIRVGRIKDTRDVKNVKFYGFTPVVVMTASSPYAELSPYLLKTKDDVILENLWQFSKVYPRVPKVSLPYSRWDKTVIWSHPAETHVKETENGWEIQDAYWDWREKGMSCEYPIRYPVGYSASARASCLFSLENEEGDPLDYVEARKKIYLKNYVKLVRKEKKFTELKERLEEGENLLILEVDGPRQESLPYYMEKYGVEEDFIQVNTTLCTEENLAIFLEDTKHPFGHGFCLAWALQK
jgi:hypothetical protein